MTNEWTKPEHAEAYLARMRAIPHRVEGEATLLSELPVQAKRALDLGCGNGHLLSLVLSHCPEATGVGLDFSPTMLEQARNRFDEDKRVTLVEHNMDDPLPDLGNFDCIVSSFAIHHCTHERKRALYAEVFSLLEPGGVFCNLEHVSSPNQRIHNRFVEAMGMRSEDEDPSNKLLDMETQLRWLREIGFEDVDCHWKWRELALIVGRKPPAFLKSESANDIDLALRLERELWAAVAAKNDAALHHLLADNYIEITLEGRRVEKTEIVNSSPQVDHIVCYEVESERFAWLGRDGFLLSYHLTLEGTYRDVAIEPPDRWATSVWSRRDAGWQCSFFQQSPFKPKCSSPAPS